MNNCSDLSTRTSKDWQKEKLDYLRAFKFSIAFENSRRIGYVTEKLYDAFLADTIPVYWGDPNLEAIVNRDAVVYVDGDWERDVLPWLRSSWWGGLTIIGGTILLAALLSVLTRRRPRQRRSRAGHTSRTLG